MTEIVPAYDRIDEIRKLFSEYTEMLLSIDPAFGLYLDMQHYDDELSDPARKYALPDGRLYLAVSGGESAGCAALRRLDGKRGEVKRLYVRPRFRGMHIATMLMERLISDSREAGYTSLYLDTLPELDAAVRLYSKLGFERTERYNDSPEEKTVFMRKLL